MANDTKRQISRKRYGYRVVGHSNRVIETGTMTKKIIVLLKKKKNREKMRVTIDKSIRIIIIMKRDRRKINET